MKRLFPLLLALTLLFSACAPAVTPEGSDAVPDTEPAEPFVILENGASAFVIIRSDSMDERALQPLLDLRKTIKEKYSVEIPIKSDWSRDNKENETVTSDETVLEILVGDTNRPESAAAREGLSVNDYVIRAVGNKIVIVGGCDLMTARAIKDFLSMLSAENGFKLAGGTDIKVEVERGDYIVALTNQGESTLEVYDISEGKLDADSLVWSYKMPYYNIAGTKLRHSEAHGDVALAVCGSSYGCMVSYPEGKLLWYTEAAASNPHSIELMPNGVIAIASSSGGEVRFFTTDKKASNTAAASVVLEDAHGVLWDEEKGVLWAIGRTVLTAYDVTLADGKVTVTEKTELRATIPSDWSHDLAPVYGNTSALWVTTSSHVYQFDKNTKTFSTDYEGHETLDRKDIKGVGNFEDGSLVYIYPDGAFKTWTSRSGFIMTKTDSGFNALTATSATGHFYKIRVWDARYQ